MYFEFTTLVISIKTLKKENYFFENLEVLLYNSMIMLLVDEQFEVVPPFLMSVNTN